MEYNCCKDGRKYHMYISKRNAIYIVQEISKIIDEKINRMN